MKETKGEPNLTTRGREPLFLRLCGASGRGSSAAERGGARMTAPQACGESFGRRVGKTYGGAAAGPELAPARRREACAGLFGPDAPSGADGAKARAAAWQAIVREVGKRSRLLELGYQDEGGPSRPQRGPVAERGV